MGVYNLINYANTGFPVNGHYRKVVFVESYLNGRMLQEIEVLGQTHFRKLILNNIHVMCTRFEDMPNFPYAWMIYSRDAEKLIQLYCNERKRNIKILCISELGDVAYKKEFFYTKGVLS